MRKGNSIFFIAAALLVFALFVGSGCGGSASSDSEESGEWMLDYTSETSGSAMTASQTKLRNFESFRMSFTDIEFGNDLKTSSGKGKVYYSFSCTAGTSEEKSKITSYSSSATSIYKEMNLTRFSDTEWVFQDDTSSIYLEFLEEKMNVTINGKGNFVDLGEQDED